MENKVRTITGTITLSDGTTSDFLIGTDAGWSQWGASTGRLGATVQVLEALAAALLEADLVVSDEDEGQDEEYGTVCPFCSGGSRLGPGEQMCGACFEAGCAEAAAEDAGQTTALRTNAERLGMTEAELAAEIDAERAEHPELFNRHAGDGN